MLIINSTTIFISLTFLAANLPFFNSKFLVFWVQKFPKKFSIYIFEIFISYFLVGGVGLFLEQKIGQIFSQNWEFYAITVAMFLTFSFPGFVYRYLLKSN